LARPLGSLLAERPRFLLGARRTGKTFLIHRTLGDAKIYDLRDTSVYLDET